jgi:hypothetical protein
MFMVHDGCDLAHCVRHPELIPLTAFLCTAGYEAAARAAILQHVHTRGAAGLVEAGLIEPDDWEPVAEAIRAGQATADPTPVPAPTPEPQPVDLSAYALAAEAAADDFDRLAIDLGYTIDAEDWPIAVSTMRRVIDRLGMHAASLRAVVGRARVAGGLEAAATEPAPPPISGGAPEPEPDADVFVPSGADERWLARNSRPPIRSAGDLLAAVAQSLAAMGLEPHVRADAVDFLFLGHLHRVELEDVEARLERCQVSDDEAAMLAAGLPIG